MKTPEEARAEAAKPAAALAAPGMPEKTWQDFLESTPPDITVAIPDALVEKWATGSGEYFIIPATDIQLHCGSTMCGDERTFSFECTTGDVAIKTGVADRYWYYRCRNCQKTSRIFALRIIRPENSTKGVIARKFGELPTYGPPVPSRVITLIGPDRQLFLKGRRAELRGLGLGAFAYYRRVVEDQTQRLFAELRRAAEALHDDAAVELLTRASKETQFTRAVELVKDALPDRLWIHNQNPLTLLHNAISNDLHAGTDEDALAVATSIRTVLTEMTARVAEITKEDAGLKQAITTLSTRKKK